MSTLKTNNVQVGQSVTATNNFTLYQPASPDGTVRLGVGNYGATTLDAITATSAGNVSIGTATNNVYDAVAAARPLVVQSSSSSTTLNGSTNSITICNSDTTTNNISQINFAAITGANTAQFSSAIISAIHGARVNGQYPAGQLSFSTASATNSAPTEKYRIAANGQQSSVIPGASTLYPVFDCRVWVAHNSSTLQGSGNVSSLVRNGVGDYTINFTTAMPDTNYAPTFMGEAGRIITKNTGSFNYARILDNGTAVDGPVGLAIFR